MASLLQQLGVLRSLHTPVVLPVPVDVDCPPLAGSSTSSQHQAFHRLDACGLLVFKPALVQVLTDQLCDALEQQAAGFCLSSRAFDLLRLALDDFHDKAPLSDYDEPTIKHTHVGLFRALEAVVPDLDALVGISRPPQRPTRVLVLPRRAVPERDPQGHPVAARIKPDLTLARAARSVPEEAVITIEVKTPSASEPLSGLFARTAQALQDGDVGRWNELENADVRSILKKEIVAAVSYGHSMFVLSDLYTYLVGAVVWTGTDQYHVVLSSLERVSPDRPDSSNFLLMLLVAFYDRYLGITAGLAPEVRRRVDGASTSQAHGAPACAVGPSIAACSSASSPTRRTSQDDPTVKSSTRCAALIELFPFAVLVGSYPDGTSFRARRVVTSPSPTHPPARTHSPTLTLASSASSIRPPLSPSTHSYPPRLTSTLCRPTAHVSSPDHAFPIQIDSLVGAGLRPASTRSASTASRAWPRSRAAGSTPPTPSSARFSGRRAQSWPCSRATTTSSSSRRCTSERATGGPCCSCATVDGRWSDGRSWSESKASRSSSQSYACTSWRTSSTATSRLGTSSSHLSPPRLPRPRPRPLPLSLSQRRSPASSTLVTQRSTSSRARAARAPRCGSSSVSWRSSRSSWTRSGAGRRARGSCGRRRRMYVSLCVVAIHPRCAVLSRASSRESRTFSSLERASEPTSEFRTCREERTSSIARR